MKFKVARTARQHKFTNSRISGAVSGVLPDDIRRDTYKGMPVTIIEWDGVTDDRGIALYVLGRVAREDPSLIVIYHVHPLNLWDRRVK